MICTVVEVVWYEMLKGKMRYGDTRWTKEVREAVEEKKGYDRLNESNVPVQEKRNRKQENCTSSAREK